MNACIIVHKHIDVDWSVSVLVFFFPSQQVNNLNWHLGCLECSVCRASLRQHNSCYVKNKEIYCKLDYFR